MNPDAFGSRWIQATLARLARVRRAPVLSLPASVRWPAAVWLFERILLSLLGIVTQRILPASYFMVPGSPTTRGWASLAGQSLIDIWQRWDAVHYEQIAIRGYSDASLSAFFPLYPLLAHWLHGVTSLDPKIALIVISNLSFLLALILLYQFCEPRYGSSAARSSVIAACLFPTAFFFYAPYPHSLALLLTLLAYLFTLQKKWLAACLAGLCAGLTHSTTIPLALLLAYTVWQTYRSDRTGFRLGRLLTPVFPILGLGTFLAWRIYQGFPGLQGLLDENWGRIHVWPWQVIWEVLTAGIFHSSIIRWLNLGLLVFGIFTTVDSIRRREIGFAIYLTSSLIFILSTSVIGEPLCGLGRYLLTVFPGFIYLGRWMQPGWRAKIIIAVSSFPHYYLCICFFLGVFIG